MAAIDPDGASEFKVIAKVIELIFGERKVLRTLHSWEAVREAQKTEDVLMREERDAIRLAREAGNGETPIKEMSQGKGQYRHYHPGDRSGGHIFYNIAGALTISHYAQGHGPVVDFLAGIADLFNPLSVGQDVLDVWDVFHPGPGPEGTDGSLDSGIDVTATAGNAASTDFSGAAANFEDVIVTNPFDAFLGGQLCIEEICTAPPQRPPVR